MTEPVYRDVRTCEHGVDISRTFRAVLDGQVFWAPECNNGRGTGHMKPHVADARYPVGKLTPTPRAPRSDKGVKRS